MSILTFMAMKSTEISFDLLQTKPPNSLCCISVTGFMLCFPGNLLPGKAALCK